MRADAGSGSVFQTTVKKRDGREYPYWCASWSLTDANGKRVFIRGFGKTQAEAVRCRGIKMQKKLSADARSSANERASLSMDQTWTVSPSRT